MTEALLIEYPEQQVFRSAEKETKRARNSFLVMIAVAIIGAIFALLKPSLSPAIQIVFVISFVSVGAIFMLWIYVAYKNVEPLGARNLYMKPRWAFLGFIVPIANLFVPKQFVDDLWRASWPLDQSGLGDPKWSNTEAPSMITYWWCTYLLYLFVLPNVLWHVAEGTWLRTPQAGVVIAAVTLVAGSTLSIKIIASVSERQARRLQEIEPPNVYTRMAVCPSCKLPLRTRYAKQCQNCYLDWHN